MQIKHFTDHMRIALVQFVNDLYIFVMQLSWNKEWGKM